MKTINKLTNVGTGHIDPTQNRDSRLKTHTRITVKMVELYMLGLLLWVWIFMGDASAQSTIPNRQWSAYLGGIMESDESYEIIYDMVTHTDLNGGNRVYLVGITSSPNFPVTPGAYQSSDAGYTSGFITCLDPQGNTIWSTYFGGDGFDILTGVTVNPKTGDVYVCGSSLSYSIDLALNGIYQTNQGSLDWIIAKFNSTGNPEWATYYGGDGRDEAQKIVWSSDNGREYLYVVGNVQSPNLGTLSTHQQNYSGNTDALLLKLDVTSGVSRVWATYFGGIGRDTGLSLAIVKDLTIYITGQTTSSTGISTTPNNSLQGLSDAYIASFNTDGMINWSRYYGGEGEEAAHDITIANGPWIVGQTNSVTNIATSNGYITQLSGGIDAFVAGFHSNNGALNYGTYFGGSSDDVALAVTFDKSIARITVCGYTNSTDLPISTLNPYLPFQPNSGGKEDGFIFSIGPSINGTTVFSTYFGGNRTDYLHAISAFESEGQGILYVGGTTFSQNNATIGRLNLSLENDGLVGKFYYCYPFTVEPSITYDPVSRTARVDVNFQSPENLLMKLEGPIGPGFSSRWPDQISTNQYNFLNIPEGDYTLQVYNTIYCNYKQNIKIQIPNNPCSNFRFLASVVELRVVNGKSVGNLEVVPVEGTAPYRLNIQDRPEQEVNGPFTVPELPSGSYEVTLTDAAGCIFKMTVNIEDMCSGFSAILTGTQRSENGAVLEDLEIIPRGGQGPYKVLIEGQTEQTGDGPFVFRGLPPGSFNTAKVVDARGCIVKPESMVTELCTDLKARAEQIINHAWGVILGAVFVLPEGGSPPYRVKIGNEPEKVGDGTIPILFFNIGLGTHEVVVIDGRGCRYITTVTVRNPCPEVTVDVSDEVDQWGQRTGVITVNVTGGWPEYEVVLLDQDENEIQRKIGDRAQFEFSSDIGRPIRPGKYIVEVRDRLRCYLRKEIEIMYRN